MAGRQEADRKGGRFLTAGQQSPYLGGYEIPGAKVEVKSAGDHLSLQVIGGPEFQVYAEAGTDRFFTLEENGAVTFARTDGKVTGIQIGGRVGKKTR